MSVEPLPKIVRVYRFDDWHSRHASTNWCHTCGKPILPEELVVSKAQARTVNKLRHAECAVRVNLVSQEQLEAALN